MDDSLLFEAIGTVIKEESAGLQKQIDSLSLDSVAIPALAIAEIKLHKSSIREYVSKMLNRDSVLVNEKSATPHYLRKV
jgi:hypothetical protein